MDFTAPHSNSEDGALTFAISAWCSSQNTIPGVYIYIIIKSREENVVPQTWVHGDSGIADSIMNSVFDWRTWLFNYLCRVSDLYGRQASASLY
jgi:hypothetical protein